MIYFFTGNSDFQIREKTLTWKKLFIEKNGDFNLTHFKSLGEIENNQISEHILSGGFMGEKKLIIIEDYPLSTENKNTQTTLKQDFLSVLLEKIPEDNIVIFSSCNPDKRSKFYKQISKAATKTETFSNKGESDIINILYQKYAEIIDIQAISLLVKYKGGNLEKSIQEITKLSITKEKISSQDIKNIITPELEESIFQIIDDILQLSPKNALKKIKILLEETNIYAFYHSLLANLRTSVYISKLQSLHHSSPQITTALNLGNRSFLANKQYRIGYNQLSKIYIDLVDIDKKMKTGKLLGSSDDDFLYEIEKAFISNQ